MASTSLVSDTIIDASATPQEVTVSIVMATLLVVLILLHVIFYIVANRKLEEWFRRFRQLLPKSRSSSTPRVTIMNVKPIKNGTQARIDSASTVCRPKTAGASWDRVSRLSDSPKKLERSYSIPPSSNENNIVILHDLQSFSLEMDTFSSENGMNAQKCETRYSKGQIEMQNPVVHNVKIQMEMDQSTTADNKSHPDSVVCNGYQNTQLPNSVTL